MAILRPRYKDAFAPVLTSSEVLAVSLEQSDYIKTVLDYACSDSQFSAKAYNAILFILTSGSVVVPEVTSISPSSATIGDPSFTLHVNGTGFTSGSQIVWNGGVEPTMYVSATELTTEVNMATATTAGDVPVAVLSEDDVLSPTVTFTLNDTPEVLRAKAEADKKAKALQAANEKAQREAAEKAANLKEPKKVEEPKEPKYVAPKFGPELSKQEAELKADKDAHKK